MKDREPGVRRKWIDTLAYLFPPLLMVAFFIVFLVSPSFYLEYILAHHHRESQLVELLTIVGAALAAGILLWTAVAQWRTERRRRGSLFPGGAFFMLLVGLAALFFAGEEVSWGQTFFKWKTPEAVAGISRETNLHNGMLGDLVHAAGNVFICTMFIVLPIVWTFRDKLRLPADWRTGIAEWPVVSCTILAMCIRGVKAVYMLFVLPEDRNSVFWVEYLGEISEQKEMLIAIAMCMYAFYRIGAVRRDRRSVSIVGSA